jgi:hypothetical protein
MVIAVAAFGWRYLSVKQVLKSEKEVAKIAVWGVFFGDLGYRLCFF